MTSSSASIGPEQATPAQQRRGMIHSTLSQVASGPAELIFVNGLLLLYLTRLGFADITLLLLLASKTGMAMLLSALAAHTADHVGIKRVGMCGCVVGIVGFVGLILAPSLPTDLVKPAAAVSILIFATGVALFNAVWFALVRGFVPRHITGRFFGLMRLSWQLSAATAVFLYSRLLNNESDLWMYQVVFAALLAGLVFKIVFYAAVPEISQRTVQRESLLTALRQVMPTPQFIPFCAYCFVLMLFTASGPALFSLVEKRHLNLGDDTISMLGGVTIVGSLIGFVLGGFVIDRIGTKTVFLVCHLGFMVTAGLFPLRDALPAMLGVTIAPMTYLGTMHVLWGILGAFSSVAMSTELFAVMPAQRRGLATAVWWSLHNGGSALSGVMASVAIGAQFLRPTWTLSGHIVSEYDALLMIFGFLTGLMVVTLGLVPSIIGRSQWMPQGSQ